MTAPPTEVIAVLAALTQKNSEPTLAADGDASIGHLDPEALAIYGSVFDAVISSNGVGVGPALVQALVAIDIDADDVNAKIVALSTDQIRAGLPRPSAPDCPDLPNAVQLDEAAAKTVGRYVDEYVAYAGARSPRTPDLYHESAALMLGSIGIARRVVLLMAFDDVYPNLAMIWIARSTLYAKTTALRIAQGIMYEVFPHLTLPHDSTMEAMVAELAGREPEKFDQMPESDQTIWTIGRNFAAQRAIVLDEFAGLMETAKKDYGGGLEEMLLRLYDCVDFYTRNTRAQGRVTINNAYLPILGASTPGGMAPFLGKPRAWEKGCGRASRF